MKIPSENVIYAKRFDAPSGLPEGVQSLVLISSNNLDQNVLSDQCLSLQEKRIYLSMASRKRMRSFLFGRIAAKYALELIREITYTDISITPGLLEQPIISCSSFDGVSISISHSENISAAIIASPGCPVGVDVEKVSVDHENEIKLACREREIQISTEFYKCNRLVAATRIWSLKESLSKCIMCGLTIPFDFYEIDRFCSENHNACYYKYFSQYIGFSNTVDDNVVSITVPKNASNFGVLARLEFN